MSGRLGGYRQSVTDSSTDRGRDAREVRDIPARGWRDVLARTRVETQRDNVGLLAAGVAFYALIAMVPGLVALVSIYGLVSTPSDVERQITDLLGAAPTEVKELVEAQLRSIVEANGAAVGIAAVIGIVVSLYSASSGTKHLIQAINAAYDEEEGRGFVKLTLLALALTIGAVVFLIAAVGIVAFLPAVLGETGLGSAARFVIGALRWLLLAAAMVVGLSVLYRFAPNRDEPKWGWASPGAVVATALWLVGSALFSIYAANFGKYNETYGSLAAIVVMMLWLFLTAFVVILGAELNAELERQTRKDTTVGPDRPLGEREAESADTVGATADEVKVEQRAIKDRAKARDQRT